MTQMNDTCQTLIRIRLDLFTRNFGFSSIKLTKHRFYDTCQIETFGISFLLHVMLTMIFSF
jgi:hypothetical protein